jgi:hypothetical protein
LLFFVFSFGGNASNGMGFPSNVPPVNVAQEVSDLSGIWSFRVPGAENGYEKGLLVISKTKAGYGLQVDLENGSLTAYDVLAEGNDLQFHVNLDGVERIGVVLRFTGHQLKGQAIAKAVTYAINGTRQLPEQ